MAITKEVKFGKTLRRSYAKYEEILDMPNLLKIQKDSYDWFLGEGLQEVFRDVAAITDYTGNLELTFLDYTMDDTPKYTVEECKERDATYAKPIKVRVRLLNKETGEIKEQEIFMGDFPLMTNGGTFVINGAERVIVSQIVRSPGVYFGDEVDKTDQHIYTATVIPYRGAWLEYETDSQECLLCPHRQKPQAAHHLPHPRPGRGRPTARSLRTVRRRSPHQGDHGEGPLQDA